MKHLRHAPFALALALSALLFAGCTSTEDPADQPEPTETTTTQPESETFTPGPEGETQIVAFTNPEGDILCPVMGAKIPEAEMAVGHQDFGGKRYYFCCGGCPEAFEKDPEKYAEGAAL